MVVELKLPASVVELNYPGGLSNEAFEELCFANKELIIEREPSGKVTIMSPVSYLRGNYEADFIADLKLYVRTQGGDAISSSTGFTLPDSSVRSPDACYLSPQKVAQLTGEELKHFTAVVPDFVVEVISPSDDLRVAQKRMTDTWIANGVRLAWLVDVESERLWIYRQNGTVDIVEDFSGKVGGEDVLPGFEFDLSILG